MQNGLDHIGVCIVFFCHDGKGNVVMAKRSQNARDEKGRWDIGGGGLDFGMPVLDCLKKEVREEYDTEVIDAIFLGFRDVHRELYGRPTHWIALDYKVLVKPEGVKLNEPHKFDGLGWFRLDSLPEPMHSQLPLFLEKYKEALQQ